MAGRAAAAAAAAAAAVGIAVVVGGAVGIAAVGRAQNCEQSNKQAK